VLQKCANPVCAAQFRYLHQGWLFEVEIHHFESLPGDSRAKPRNCDRHVERWWLCEPCAVRVSLQFDPRLGLVMVSSVEGSRQVVTTAVQPSNPQPSNPRPSNPRTGAGIARILIRPLDLDRTGWTQRSARRRLDARGSEAA
jgi:hypothetical protein